MILVKISIILSVIIFLSGCFNNSVNEDIESKNYQEGVHYSLLNEVIKEDIYEENYVIKIFWIGCEYCQKFEPVIKSYKNSYPDIKIKRMHSPLTERWALDSRIYYALMELGYEELYVDLLNLYINKRIEFGELPEYNDFALFLNDKNIEPELFFETADSEIITEKIISVRDILIENEITSVPAIVVNGIYKINQNLPSDINSQEDYNDLINYLINKRKK